MPETKVLLEPNKSTLAQVIKQYLSVTISIKYPSCILEGHSNIILLFIVSDSEVEKEPPSISILEIITVLKLLATDPCFIIKKRFLQHIKNIKVI